MGAGAGAGSNLRAERRSCRRGEAGGAGEGVRRGRTCERGGRQRRRRRLGRRRRRVGRRRAGEDGGRDLAHEVVGVGAGQGRPAVLALRAGCLVHGQVGGLRRDAGVAQELVVAQVRAGLHAAVAGIRGEARLVPGPVCVRLVVGHLRGGGGGGGCSGPGSPAAKPAARAGEVRGSCGRAAEQRQLQQLAGSSGQVIYVAYMPHNMRLPPHRLRQEGAVHVGEGVHRLAPVDADPVGAAQPAGAAVAKVALHQQLRAAVLVQRQRAAHALAEAQRVAVVARAGAQLVAVDAKGVAEEGAVGGRRACGGRCSAVCA
jgi:hypothetical protein